MIMTLSFQLNYKIVSDTMKTKCDFMNVTPTKLSEAV